MGAGASNELGPLAFAAVAEITRFDLDQLRVSRQYLHLLLSDDHEDDEQSVDNTDSSSQQQPHHDHALSLHNEPNLSQTQFEEALESAYFFASDRAIFDKLFTLMDRTGDAVIFATEFLIGLCALLKGDLASKLQAAFELLQHHEKSQKGSSDGIPVSKGELAFVLTAMAQVATYFGDPPMLKASVLSIVDDVYAPLTPPPITEEEGEQEEPKGEDSDENPDAHLSSSASLSSSEATARVVQHHTVDSYIRGHFVRRGTIVHEPQ